MNKLTEKLYDPILSSHSDRVIEIVKNLKQIGKKIESEYELQRQYLNNTSKYQEGMEIKFKKVLRKK